MTMNTIEKNIFIIIKINVRTLLNIKELLVLGLETFSIAWIGRQNQKKQKLIYFLEVLCTLKPVP